MFKGLNEDLRTFVKTSRLSLLRMSNVSDKCCGKNQNTHFRFNYCFPENRTVYEIMWKNIVQPDIPLTKIQPHGHNI